MIQTVGIFPGKQNLSIPVIPLYILIRLDSRHCPSMKGLLNYNYIQCDYVIFMISD